MNATEPSGDALRCAGCGWEAPSFWRILRVGSSEEIFPHAAVAQGGFNGGLSGYLPLCSRCLRVCPTCGHPVIADAVEGLLLDLEVLNRPEDLYVRWWVDPCSDDTHERPPREEQPPATPGRTAPELPCVVCKRVAPVVWRALQFVCLPEDRPDRFAIERDDDAEPDDERVRGFVPVCSWCLLVCPTCDRPVPASELERMFSNNPEGLLARYASRQRFDIWWSNEPCHAQGHRRPAREPRATHPDVVARTVDPPDLPNGWSAEPNAESRISVGDLVAINIGDVERNGRISHARTVHAPYGGTFAVVEFRDGSRITCRAGALDRIEASAELPAVPPAVAKLFAQDAYDFIERAEAAFEARLDRDDGYIDSLIASALADAILAARHDTNVGAEELDEILALADLYDTDELIAELLDAETFDELFDCLVRALENSDRDELVALFGTTEEIGGFDSSDFAVMTAGSMTTWVVRRKGRVLLMETGDDAGAPYVLEDAGREKDDPYLRRARLELAKSLSGLGPGVWIADADDIDDELREITMSSGWWDEWWTRITRGYEDELVESHLRSFAAITRLDSPVAPARLQALFLHDSPASDAERRAVWKIWKKERL